MTIAKASRTFSLLTIVLLLVTAYFVYALRGDINHLHFVDGERAILQTLTKELQESSLELTVAARNFAVTGKEQYVKQYQHVVDERTGKTARSKEKFVAPGETISLLDLSHRSGCTDEEMGLLNESMRRSVELAKMEAKAIALVHEGKRDEAIAIMFADAYDQERAKIAEPLVAFDKMLITRINGEIAKASADVNSSMIIVCVTIALNILLALFSSFFSNSRIVKRLEICSAYARNLAEGKYANRLEKKHPDELGTMVDTLNQMVDSLQERVNEANRAMEQAKDRQDEAEKAMKEAEAAKAMAERAKRDGMLQAANDLTSVVEAVGEVSRALSDGIVKSDQGAKNQAHIVQETAGSMDEMKTAVHGVAQSASDAANVATDVRSKAQEGVEQVAQVTESMAELSEASAKISQDMEALGKQANDIGAILSVISDIADQTNLLALNAAIEAARAGEAGRGFAVVADEVRKLAEKTMSATQEVNHAISSIQDSVHSNIENVGKTGEMAQNVTDIVQKSGVVLDEILQLAEASADQVRTIAAASEEQSVSCDHISQSVDNISNIASSVADTMQEADNAVKTLLQQADRLSNLIEDMKRA